MVEIILYIEALREEMSHMRKEVEEALKRTNKVMKQKFNKNKEPE